MRHGTVNINAQNFEQAATVPISGQAAMMNVILCAIKPGDKVLINGASGGVGSFGVQIAKAQGAHVTAMCSAAKADAVKSWGADEIVDYKRCSTTSCIAIIPDLRRLALVSHHMPGMGKWGQRHTAAVDTQYPILGYDHNARSGLMAHLGPAGTFAQKVTVCSIKLP